MSVAVGTLSLTLTAQEPNMLVNGTPALVEPQEIHEHIMIVYSAEALTYQN